MELGTFGAILRFAMDLEEQAMQFYNEPAQGRLTESFSELARGSRKRLKRLERGRREFVAEMILEPITGLDADSYILDLDPKAQDSELVRQAQVLEEVTARFYRDAAAKMPIREVVRLFQRLERENEQRRTSLKQDTE